jgi:excisionase family DNA binding protein
MLNTATVELTTEASFFDKLKWLTSKEAAFLLRTSPGQIRNLVWERRLKAFHYGNRLRFLRSDVERLMQPPSSRSLERRQSWE